MQDTLHNVMKYEFMIALDEAQNIDKQVDNDIVVTLGEFVIEGTLLKTQSKKIKDKESGEYDIYKQLTIEVHRISQNEGQQVMFPEKKKEYFDEIEVD
jgi:hypothetical protein